MAASTSGTYAFNPEISEISIEAWERLGKAQEEMPATYARSVRRSLNYLFVDWANEGCNQWAVVQDNPFTVTQGQATYQLAAGTVDVLEMTLTRNGQELPMTPIGRAEYVSYTDKTTQGRPSTFCVFRTIPTASYSVYPAPENSTDTITVWRLRQMQDVTAGYQTADVPYRFQEALVSGLAAKIAVKYAPDRQQMLQGMADKAFQLAWSEDRERVATILVPDFGGAYY